MIHGLLRIHTRTGLASRALALASCIAALATSTVFSSHVVSSQTMVFDSAELRSAEANLRLRQAVMMSELQWLKFDQSSTYVKTFYIHLTNHLRATT